MYVSEPYHNAVELQRLIMRDARGSANDPEKPSEQPQAMKPHDLAALARAFCDLEETKRKLKMKPLPGSLRPTDSRPKRKQKEQVTFSPEPTSCVVQAPSNSVPDPSQSIQTPQEPQSP